MKIVIGFRVFSRTLQIASFIGAFCFVYIWFVLSGRLGWWLNEDKRAGFVSALMGLWSLGLIYFSLTITRNAKERLLLLIGVVNFIGTILMRTLTPLALMPYPVVYLIALNSFTLGYVFYALFKSDNNGDY